MTTMKTRREHETTSIREQAADWLLILESRKPEDLEAFADWLAQSPLHVDAFLRMSAIDSLLSEVDPEHSIVIDGTPMPDTGPDICARPPVAESPTADSRTRWRPQWGAWAMAAGLGTLMIAIGMLTSPHSLVKDPQNHYATAVGEQRTVPLEDGSFLYLNTGSAVSVHFTAKERLIRLESGEAMFKVSRNPTRPFLVNSGNSIIQAIGTQFNVRRRQGDSIVSVTEGVVQVSRERRLNEFAAGRAEPVRIEAGEELQIARDGSITRPVPVDIERINAWRTRRLIFQNDTLATIADEFNRYNLKPKIRIEDAGVGARHFALAFDADDPESLAAILNKDPTLQVEQSPDVIVIRAR